MNARERLDAILARAGLKLSEEDRERLARNLPFYTEQREELRITEARYVEPPVIFHPEA